MGWVWLDLVCLSTSVVSDSYGLVSRDHFHPFINCMHPEMNDYASRITHHVIGPKFPRISFDVDSGNFRRTLWPPHPPENRAFMERREVYPHKRSSTQKHQEAANRFLNIITQQLSRHLPTTRRTVVATSCRISQNQRQFQMILSIWYMSVHC